MAKDWETITTGGLEDIFVFDVDDPISTRRKVFTINAATEQVFWFPDVKSLENTSIIFEGFKSIPPELNKGGWIKTFGFQYQLAVQLSTLRVDELVISRTAEKKIRKRRNAGHAITLPYTTFQTMASKVKSVNESAKVGRRMAVATELNSSFPTNFSAPSVSASRRKSTFLAGIDSGFISELSAEEIDRIFEFTGEILEKRYTAKNSRLKLYGSAKLNIDSVALAEVISEFEKLLGGRTSEAQWGKFLFRNLFLVESRYIQAIPEMNVVLAKSRKVDFGMVDTAGFLDLWEIKKPETKLLSAKPDRDNFYWHSDATKAITQAEKYLYNAEKKGLSLESDIKRQMGIEVKVIRPRGVVIMGSNSQLDNDNKREDFRVLRQALKNIEVVTYDELLGRLVNQKSKVYS